DFYFVEAGLLELGGEELFDGDEDFVEFGVADDEGGGAAGAEDALEGFDVGGHVVEVFADVGGEEGAGVGDGREAGLEARGRRALRWKRLPGAEVARGGAPGAADGAPIEHASGLAIAQVLEPVHVGPELADVAHAVGVRG